MSKLQDVLEEEWSITPNWPDELHVMQAGEAVNIGDFPHNPMRAAVAVLGKRALAWILKRESATTTLAQQDLYEERLAIVAAAKALEAK